MELLNEEVVYQNPLLYLKVWEIQTDSPKGGIPVKWPWHYHKEVELLAILDGHLGVQTKHDYTTLGPGDVMIVGSSQPHRSNKISPGTLRYLVFQVDLLRHFDQSTMSYLPYFAELTHPLTQLNYIFRENEAANREAHALINDIYAESQSLRSGIEFAIRASIQKLLLLLVRSDNRNALKRLEVGGIARLRPVLDYADNHLADHMAVEDMCPMLGFSYHYFIKYFKKTMGMSFVDYVNYKRIKKAERLLMTSNLNIVDIGYEVGISNMAQFYKLFKRHNQCSPKEFKRRMLAPYA